MGLRGGAATGSRTAPGSPPAESPPAPDRGSEIKTGREKGTERQHRAACEWGRGLRGVGAHLGGGLRRGSAARGSRGGGGKTEESAEEALRRRDVGGCGANGSRRCPPTPKTCPPLLPPPTPVFLRAHPPAHLRPPPPPPHSGRRTKPRAAPPQPERRQTAPVERAPPAATESCEASGPPTAEQGANRGGPRSAPVMGGGVKRYDRPSALTNPGPLNTPHTTPPLSLPPTPTCRGAPPRPPGRRRIGTGAAAGGFMAAGPRLLRGDHARFSAGHAPPLYIGHAPLVLPTAPFGAGRAPPPSVLTTPLTPPPSRYRPAPFSLRGPGFESRYQKRFPPVLEKVRLYYKRPQIKTGGGGGRGGGQGGRRGASSQHTTPPPLPHPPLCSKNKAAEMR